MIPLCGENFPTELRVPKTVLHARKLLLNIVAKISKKKRRNFRVFLASKHDTPKPMRVNRVKAKNEVETSGTLTGLKDPKWSTQRVLGTHFPEGQVSEIEESEDKFKETDSTTVAYAEKKC